MILAIIPARSGSKRIKNKNIKIFNGKPIIGHVIENLKKINLFDRIIVSTDSERIAKISKKYGAEIPFLRSKKLSNDYVATKEVIRDTIKKLKLNSKNDYVCCIYPTSVFVKQKYLKIAIKNILKRDEFFFSAKKFQHPIQRSFYKKNKLYFFNKKLIKTRTQDLTEYYHDAAQFYFAKVKTWQTKDIINPSSNFIEIPINECQDVDTFEDWKVAEILWRYLKKNHKI